MYNIFYIYVSYKLKNLSLNFVIDYKLSKVLMISMVAS